MARAANGSSERANAAASRARIVRFALTLAVDAVMLDALLETEFPS
jgi:hypothetical protein